MSMPSVSTLTTDANESNKSEDDKDDNGDGTVAQGWDADRYQGQHSFVYEYGSSLLQVLDAKPGEYILDLGCGTGELTMDIHNMGCKVLGVDADERMIARARTQFPRCDFRVADARRLDYFVDEPVDAIFSNAALHWIPQADRVATSISNALKPGGRLVAELGGKGNIAKIAHFLDSTMGSAKNPWYFPSIAEYSTLLDSCGMEVTYAHLYDRPTVLTGGEKGLRNWILMFGRSFLDRTDDEERELLLAGAERELRDDLYDGEQWLADYRRLRIVATKL